MATYTSVQNGNWNNSATWGGSGYPSAAGDIANIGHTVTYNVVSTTALGAITINNNGILTFSPTMSTKLTLGHQEITINSGGELRVGASGAVIPQAYTAELIWTTTSDNAKGINLAASGKLTIYGDPTYYGSKFDYILATQVVIPAATNAVTVTVAGNYATNFVAGQELLIHKGGTYASYINDFARLAVVSAANNGANTDISCTVTERPAALTCLVGADVLNVSRNVLLYKLSYNANLGQTNSNRPRLTNSNTVGNNNINIYDAIWGGWYNVIAGNNIIFNGVIRNGNIGASTPYYGSISGIIFSCTNGVDGGINVPISAMLLANSNSGCRGLVGLQSIISGAIFGNLRGISYCDDALVTGPIYANGTGFAGGIHTFTGKLGYNQNDVAMPNGTSDLSFNPLSPSTVMVKLLNAKVTAGGPSIGARNSLLYPGRFLFEHYQQVANAHYIADAFGDVTKVSADGSGTRPTQRVGGSAEVCEALAQSNCASAAYLDILPPINGPQPLRLWGMANVSKTYRFYLQTDFTALAKSALVLYADYLDQGSGGHLATVSSSTSGNFTTRANQSDWSQYVEVTVTPAQDGYITLYLRLMGYESGKKVWVDPLPSVAGKVYQVHWSYGEVVLVEIGGGIIAADAGLLPLGVMEAII
jgi:hypothetical protein